MPRRARKGVGHEPPTLIGRRGIPAIRHGATHATETPLPTSHPGVGRHPCGAEPQLCEPALRGDGAGGAWTIEGPRPPPRPPCAVHLDLGGVPTIFWGSYEPGAGCLLPCGAAPCALIQKGDWCGSAPIRRHRRENRRRVRGHLAALRGMSESVCGHEKIRRAIARGQLKGRPLFPQSICIRPLTPLIHPYFRFRLDVRSFYEPVCTET